MVKYPNFLIIGVAKCGTTSLYYYLKQHPEIFMSIVKEPNFFTHDMMPKGASARVRTKVISNPTEYHELFAGVTSEKAIGEASVSYLAYPQVAERIYQELPKVKLIAILRNPAERAYSAYTYARQLGVEKCANFEEAIQKDEEKRAQKQFSVGYKHRGFYSIHLQHYYKIFPKEQIRVYLHDDLKNDRLSLLKDIFQYLEVDDSFIPDMKESHNVTRQPRNTLLNDFLIKPNPLHDFLIKVIPLKVRKFFNVYKRNLGDKFPPLPQHSKIALLKEYREDILQLQTLIDRDLSNWLRPLAEDH